MLADPTFTRATGAYKQDGASVASGEPRYEAAKYNNGITAEEGATNLCTANQSDVETDTTGFDSYHATISRDTTQFWRGAASLKVVTTDVDGSAYFPVGSRPAVSPGDVCTYSIWLRGDAGGESVQLWLDWYDAAHAFVSRATAGPFTLTTAWTRYTVTGTAPANTAEANPYPYIALSGKTIFEDGFQFEKKAYPTSWQVGGTARNAETFTVPQAAISSAAGTVETWVKLLRAPGTSRQFILDANGAASHGLQLYVETDGKLECVYGNGSGDTTLNGTTVLAVDTLYHVAVTWSVAGVEIYVNGGSEDTDATAPSVTAGASVYLGSKADGTLQLDGILDDVRIEDNARSDTDIADDAASGTALPSTWHTLYRIRLDDALTHKEGILPGQAVLSASGSIAAAGRRNAITEAILSASGSIAAAGHRAFAGLASLSALGTVVASGRRNAIASAALSALGTVVAAGRLIASATAALAAAGGIAALGSAQYGARASLTASGSVTAAGRMRRAGKAVLAAVGAVIANMTGGQIQWATLNLPVGAYLPIPPSDPNATPPYLMRLNVAINENYIRLRQAADKLNRPPENRPEVTGQKDGNTALESLILGLTNLGIIKDSTS